MSAAGEMKDLLAPLGVYRLEGIFNGSELDAAGAAMEQVEQELEEIQREMCPLTAESWGLEKLAGLFAARPGGEDPRSTGEAIAALLRIGGDSFTLGAINDALKGCGLPVRAEEYGVGEVRVSFPGIPGIPENFSYLRQMAEAVLPAHVKTFYNFWYLTWGDLEQKFPTWAALEEKGLTWKELEECM